MKNNKQVITWGELLVNTPIIIKNKLVDQDSRMNSNSICDIERIYRTSFFGSHPHLRKFFNVDRANVNKQFTDEDLEQIIWSIGNLHIGLQKRRKVNYELNSVLVSFRYRLKAIEAILRGIEKSGFNVNIEPIYFVNEGVEYKRRYYITSFNNIKIANKELYFGKTIMEAILNRKFFENINEKVLVTVNKEFNKKNKLNWFDKKGVDKTEKNNKPVQCIDKMNEFLTDHNVAQFFKVCIDNLDNPDVNKSIKHCILDCNIDNLKELNSILEDIIYSKDKSEDNVVETNAVKKQSFLSKVINFFSANHY